MTFRSFYPCVWGSQFRPPGSCPPEHPSRSLRRHDTYPHPSFHQPSRIQPRAVPVQVAEAIALLRSATRPVVIAGSGAWWAGAGPELIQFAESTHLPVFTIGLARGLMPDSHPLCLGYADPALNWAARDSLREADVVLIIGKRLDYRLAMGGSRVFSSEARFIQIRYSSA